MRMLIPAILVFFLAAPAQAGSDMKEDFSSYAQGRPPAEEWWRTGFFWTVKEGELRFSDPGRSFAGPAKVPYGRAGRIAADMRLEAPVGNQWKTAGLALYADEGNYWALLLVEDPEGTRRFAELREMQEGFWGAENEREETRLIPSDFARERQWEYGTRYRLILEFSQDGIGGEIRDPEGELLWRGGYEFPAGVPAVKSGMTALAAGGFSGSFDRVEARIDAPVPAPAAEIKFSPYDMKPASPIRFKSSGFFRTAKKRGRWWLVDPEGYAFFSVGTDHVNYNVHWCEKLGHAPYHRNVAEKYGSEDAWGDSTLRRLKLWGFNTLGANQSLSLRRKGMAHTEHILSMGTSFGDVSEIVPKVHWTGFPNVFHPDWEGYCDFIASKVCAQAAEDPWLLGYFIDNELEWEGKDHTEYGLINEIFKKPADHTAKQAFADFLEVRHRNIRRLNEAWEEDFASFDEFRRLTVPSRAATKAATRDREQFLAIVAERYFKTACEAIRRYDSSHLILGCRFWGKAPRVVWRTAGKYLDVVSTNYYGPVDLEAGTAEPIKEDLERFGKLTGRPMMVTEWSYPALDSGLPCIHGAGQRLDTQEQRARAYAIFQRMVAGLPFMVGSQFFMWVDEPAEGISSAFPEDSNYGLVDVNDKPYPELTQTAAKLNPELAVMHSGETAELCVSLDEGKGRVLVKNSGRVAAACALDIWEDGKKHRVQLNLKAGKTAVELLTPGSLFALTRINPEETAPESDLSDNSAFGFVGRPPKIEGELAVAVANPSDVRLKDVTVAPFKEKPGLSLAVSELPPYGVAVLHADVNEGASPAAEEIQVPFELAGERLRLRKFEPDGDLIDEVSLDGIKLGKVQIMIHQAGGQKLWIPANRLVSVHRTEAEAETVLDFTADFVPGGNLRTTVDEKGREETQVESGGAFRAKVRLKLPRRGQIFGLKMISVQNTGKEPWFFASYFHYLQSFIGGSPEGDAPPLSGVPMYYGLNTLWYDPNVKAGYGAVAPEGVSAFFWLDEAGSQHPDVHRDVGVTLAPGETWLEEGREVTVFGLRGAERERSWNSLKRDLDARRRVLAKVWL